MSSERTFQSLPHGHHDLVLAADYNFYGTRLVTASSDHRLKVWDKKRELWELVDSWRAHDAEITEVRWNGPFAGHVLGSIGEDGFFKLWQEDVTQAPNSGRRFRSIMHPVAAKSKLPWMSLDFKNINSDTYLALITRDGTVSITEPKDHDNLSGEWTDWLNTIQVSPVPSRAEEASFKIRFHPDKLPCWTAVAAGLDRKALSLAIVAMESVKVYRTDKDRHWYLAAELTGARSLVRDVAWSPGSVRGFDVIATAGKDGVVRVYELKTPAAKVRAQEAALSPSPQKSATSSALDQTVTQVRTTGNPPSGIGAGLAGVAKVQDDRINDNYNPSRVKHTVELVAELKEHRGAVWRVCFSAMGDILMSTGDDGTVRTWKKGLNSGWFEFAEINVKRN